MICSKCARRLDEGKQGVHACESCGGTFVEQNVIKGKIPALIFRGVPARKSDFTCPLDDSRMQATTIAGVELEHCETCGGVWFDKHEMERVKKQIRSDFNMPKDPLRDVDLRREETWVDDLFDLF